MLIESFWNYEQFWNAEKRENLNYDLSFLSNSQNIIESEARDYVLKEQASWRDTTELTKDLNELIERQRNENELLEKQIWTETKEKLDKEALINEARITLYDKLWLNNNLESNSIIQKFLKWFVDELLIWNYELAIEVYNTWWKAILENLSKLASYEWLKQIAESLWDNVKNLLSWNSYEKWKSFAELWIVSTWVWLWIALWKKWLKLWIKQLSKMRLDKKSIVKSPEIKDVIWEVNWKLDEILPKQELDFEKLVKDDIIEKWKEELIPDKQDLMQWKVNESVSNQNSLYDDPEYDYLIGYKEILWENIDISNILWEWVNGIVLKHPTNWTVIKIRKPWMDKDDIWIEIDNHNKILWKLEELKSWENPNIDKSVKIPEIIDIDSWYLKTFYTMEKIEWQTLSTRIFRNEHPWLKLENFEFLDTLTDRQIIELMTKKYWSKTDLLKKIRDDNKWKYLDDWLESGEWNKLKVAIDMLKIENMEHTDLHTGNIMIDKNWNTYLIDFWTAKVK